MGSLLVPGPYTTAGPAFTSHAALRMHKDKEGLKHCHVYATSFAGKAFLACLSNVPWLYKSKSTPPEPAPRKLGRYLYHKSYTVLSNT